MGRFQPFHIGHEAIIHEIIADGLEPIIVLGSCNKGDYRNIFEIHERVKMIEIVFPGTRILFSDDYDSWDLWWSEIQVILSVFLKNSIFYINHKFQDRQSFKVKDKLYDRSYYTDIIEDAGYPLKHVTYPQKLGISNINATDIREDLEKHKHYLDSRVYNFIKNTDKLLDN